MIDYLRGENRDREIITSHRVVSRLSDFFLAVKWSPGTCNMLVRLYAHDCVLILQLLALYQISHRKAKNQVLNDIIIVIIYD